MADRATPPYRGLPYVAGLDGVRAIAVAGVLLYHGGVAKFSGGFLGVDVFFVLSGFLITSLLLSERARRGHIDLAAFWLRRARRLLPAAFLVVGVCTLVVAVFYPSLLPRARGDAIASFFYVNNWHQAFAHESYFAALGRPPMLQHLWSLAVEEQFYLVWPIVLALCLNRLGRWPTALVTIIGAGASALAMGLLFQLGHDPSRVYYGTDTHASGLLVGALLACLAPLGGRRPAPTRGRGLFLDFLGVAALIAIFAAMTSWHDYDPAVYRGGLLLFAVAVALLLLVLTDPAAHIGAVLGVAPMRWIGQRSYGIYLWHWPVMVLTRPGIDLHWNRWVLVPAQIGVAVLLAAASYRWVEMPVRRGDAWRGDEALARPLRAAPAAGDRDGDDRRVPRHGGLGRGAPDAASRDAAQERADRGGDRRAALQRDGQAAGRRRVGDACRLAGTRAADRRRRGGRPPAARHRGAASELPRRPSPAGTGDRPDGRERTGLRPRHPRPAPGARRRTARLDRQRARAAIVAGRGQPHPRQDRRRVAAGAPGRLARRQRQPEAPVRRRDPPQPGGPEGLRTRGRFSARAAARTPNEAPGFRFVALVGRRVGRSSWSQLSAGPASACGLLPRSADVWRVACDVVSPMRGQRRTQLFDREGLATRRALLAAGIRLVAPTESAEYGAGAVPPFFPIGKGIGGQRRVAGHLDRTDPVRPCLHRCRHRPPGSRSTRQTPDE